MWQMIIPVIGNLLDKIIPDPQQAAAAKLEALKLAQQGELASLDAEMRLALGQLEVNKAEAATDTFRGGWRPFAGWVCGTGLAYQFLLQPILPWAVAVAGVTVPPLPPIDSATLMTLLMGMLGLGGLRTYERVQGKIPTGQ
jgi:hypothetical protein